MVMDDKYLTHKQKAATTLAARCISDSGIDTLHDVYQLFMRLPQRYLDVLLVHLTKEGPLDN